LTNVKVFEEALANLNRSILYPTDRWDLAINYDTLMRNGKRWADYIIDKLSVPPAYAKSVEMISREFAKPRRPKDIPAWFEKNKKRLEVLLLADKWPQASENEGTEGEVFKHGGLTIHNVIRASGKALEDALKTLDIAMRNAAGTGISDFRSVVYGDVYLVGQLGRKNWAAWYMPAKDMIYLRPGVRGLPPEECAQHLLHEFGHRYWKLKLSREVMGTWNSHHYLMEHGIGAGGDAEAKMPEVGDALPMNVDRKKVKVEKIEKSTYSLVAVDTGAPAGTISFSQLFNWLYNYSIAEKFPTLYARTDAEEHFCEALSLRALGKLKAHNLEAFDKIVLGEGKGQGAVRVAGRWLRGKGWAR